MMTAEDNQICGTTGTHRPQLEATICRYGGWSVSDPRYERTGTPERTGPGLRTGSWLVRIGSQQSNLRATGKRTAPFICDERRVIGGSGAFWIQARRDGNPATTASADGLGCLRLSRQDERTKNGDDR